MIVRRVSVSESRQSLPSLLREVEEADTTILIYRRDHLAGALVGAEAYERLMRLQAYLDALALSSQLGKLPVHAVKLARTAREDVERAPLRK